MARSKFPKIRAICSDKISGFCPNMFGPDMAFMKNFKFCSDSPSGLQKCTNPFCFIPFLVEIQVVIWNLNGIGILSSRHHEVEQVFNEPKKQTNISQVYSLWDPSSLKFWLKRRKCRKSAWKCYFVYFYHLSRKYFLQTNVIIYRWNCNKKLWHKTS